MSDVVSAPAAAAAPVATPSSPTSPDAKAAAPAALDATAKPVVAEAPKPPTAAEIKKWKLKIDGQDVDMTEDELVKNAQLGRAGQKRMQEAAQLRKNMEGFIEMLRKDPVRVLSDPNIGVDVKRMAEAIINNELEEMQKSPELKEKEKLERELKELRDKHKKDEEDRKSAEFQRLQQQASVQLEGDIITALKDGGLPKTPYTVKKMAEIMMTALANDIDLSAKDILPLMKQQMHSEVREMFASAPEDVMEEMLGKDNVTRLRKRAVARAKAAKSIATVEAVKPTGNTEVKKKTEETKKLTARDFFKNLG